MSTVGRIFIVLNLVLTFVLVGFVGAYLYSSNSYRVAYEGLREHGETQYSQERQKAEGLKNQNSALTARVSELETKLQQAEADRNQVWDAYTEERASMKTLADNFRDFISKIEGWDQVYANLTAKVDEYNNAIGELQRKQTQAAEAQRVARNREVAAASFQVRAELINESLRKQLLDQRSQIEELQAKNAVLQQINPGVGSPEIPQDLVGRVLSVSPDGNLMTVEFSGAPVPIKVGWTMALQSDIQFKGFVRITEVHGTGSATVRMVNPSPGTEAPAAGDRVRAVVF